MGWIELCDEKSLNDEDLVGFDYQDIMITKGKIINS